MPDRGERESLRVVRLVADAALSSAQRARALALEAMGWDGLSARDQVSRVEVLAAEAEELARGATDDLAEMTARLAELVAEVAALSESNARLEAQVARLAGGGHV